MHCMLADARLQVLMGLPLPGIASPQAREEPNDLRRMERPQENGVRSASYKEFASVTCFDCAKNVLFG